MTSNPDVNKIFKPVPINEQGKPIRGYTVYIDGELPSCLVHKHKKTAYKITRPDKTVVAIVPVTFPKTVREELENLKYEFVTTSRNKTDPIKSINGIRVRVRNLNWQKKWSVTIDKGSVNEIIDGTKIVLKYLIKNKVVLNEDSICDTYCGLPITSDDIDNVRKFKRT